MRTTDRPEDFDGLGPVKKPEPPASPMPQQVGNGILRGTDGKLYTEIEPPAPPEPWYRGLYP